jgi:uncharacterized protein YegP (UPF0339 family)
MKIQVLKKRVYWYYRIIATNGQVMLTSETYDSKSNATRAATEFLRQQRANSITLEVIE